MARKPAPEVAPDAGRKAVMDDHPRPVQDLALPIVQLVANPRNPRVHPPTQIDMLKASLRRDGQTKPILVRTANRMIIAGHGVTEAARQLGWPCLSVLLWDVDQETADRVMLADNRFGELSTSNTQRVAELLGEINQADYLATGFSEEDVLKLMASFDEDIEVMTIEHTIVSDDFWLTCRGPLAEQALVLARIKVLLAEYPTVSVEMGTITGI